MAGGATLRESRLVQVRLLHLFRLLAVAIQAGRDWVWLDESGCPAGVRVVTGSAIALRAGMLYLGFLNLLCLLAMAGDANQLRLRLRQNHLAVLRGLMTGIARAAFEWRMRELLHQVGLG